MNSYVVLVLALDASGCASVGTSGINYLPPQGSRAIPNDIAVVESFDVVAVQNRISTAS